MQSKIGENGYPVLDIRVKLDGVPIKSNAEKPPTAAPATDGSASPLAGISPGLIGGVAAAGVLCVVTAFFVYREHNRRRRLENGGDKNVEIASDEDDKDDEDPENDSEAPSPRMSNLKSRKRFGTKSFGKEAVVVVPPPDDDNLEDLSLSGILSNDSSMFVSENGRSPSVSERSYDISRLDMVITSIKAQEWIPDNNDDDDAPPTPKQSNRAQR